MECTDRTTTSITPSSRCTRQDVDTVYYTNVFDDTREDSFRYTTHNRLCTAHQYAIQTMLEVHSSPGIGHGRRWPTSFIGDTTGCYFGAKCAAHRSFNGNNYSAGPRNESVDVYSYFLLHYSVVHGHCPLRSTPITLSTA